MAGTVVARVIRGRPVGKVLEPSLALDRLERLEQLLLAVEASIGIVPCVGFELDLARRDLDQAGAQRSRQRTGCLLFRFGVRGRACLLYTSPSPRD